MWLADKHPTFDRVSVYRRKPEIVRDTGPKLSGWDAVLMLMVSIPMILIGLFGVIVGLFVLGVIVSTWFG